MIAQDATASLMYVMNVMDSKPWPKGEPVISRNVHASLFYVANVLKGRFKLAEDLLASEPWSAQSYAHMVGQTWTEMGRPEVDEQLLQLAS